MRLSFLYFSKSFAFTQFCWIWSNSSFSEIRQNFIFSTSLLFQCNYYKFGQTIYEKKGKKYLRSFSFTCILQTVQDISLLKVKNIIKNYTIWAYHCLFAKLIISCAP